MAEENPNNFDEMTVAELRERASKLEITGRSSMNKDDLLQSVKDAEEQLAMMQSEQAGNGSSGQPVAVADPSEEWQPKGFEISGNGWSNGTGNGSIEAQGESEGNEWSKDNGPTEAKGESESDGGSEARAEAEANGGSGGDGDSGGNGGSGGNGESGDDDDSEDEGGEQDASDIPAPSIGPNTTIEHIPPEERLDMDKISSVDAMGLDKRRQVGGQRYGASPAKQAAVYGGALAVIAALVLGGVILTNELDKPPPPGEVEPAPWAGNDLKPPPPIDFPRSTEQ